MKKNSFIVSSFIFCFLIWQGNAANAGYIHSIQIGGEENKETFQYIGNDANVENKEENDDDYYTECLYGDKYKDEKECKKIKREYKALQQRNKYYYEDDYLAPYSTSFYGYLPNWPIISNKNMHHHHHEKQQPTTDFINSPQPPKKDVQNTQQHKKEIFRPNGPIKRF